MKFNFDIPLLFLFQSLNNGKREKKKETFTAGVSNVCTVSFRLGKQKFTSSRLHHTDTYLRKRESLALQRSHLQG